MVSRVYRCLLFFSLFDASKGTAEALNDGNHRKICFSQDGSFLASGHDNGTIRVSLPLISITCVLIPRPEIWDVSQMTMLVEIAAHRGRISFIGFFDSDATLVSCSNDEGLLKLWSVKTGAIIHDPVDIHDVWDLAIWPRHPKFVVVASLDKNSFVYDTELDRRFSLPKRVETVAFTPDGCSLITSTWSEGLTRWDLGPLSGYVEPMIQNNPPSDLPKICGAELDGPQVSSTIAF